MATGSSRRVVPSSRENHPLLVPIVSQYTTVGQSSRRLTWVKRGGRRRSRKGGVVVGEGSRQEGERVVCWRAGR